MKPFKYYDKYQEKYLRPKGYFGPIAKKVSHYLTRHQPNILDIGCGYGDFLLALHQLYSHAHLFGLTLSTAEYKHLRKIHNLRATKGNQKQLQSYFRPNYFDLVINFHTLSYLHQPEQKATLTQITQLVKKKGFLLLGLIDGWIKNDSHTRQFGQGYVQFYYTPSLFIDLDRHFRLRESYLEPRNHYRIQLWQKRVKPNCFPVHGYILYLYYIAKSIFIR